MIVRDISIGITDLSFASTEYCLSHRDLADYHGVEINKYHVGIGQNSMSVPAADEDIVTMAAAAAAPIIERHGADRIRTVMLATETSIDQSKSAGVYVHSLLGLPSAARVVELKQACYSATAALQFAVGLVGRDPSQQVLVVASDVSKYELESPGEATQGAAAVAMLVGSNPALLSIEEPSGIATVDVMDFWRPNYLATALVDGPASISAYLHAVDLAWKDYTYQGGRTIGEFHAFCYHQPFTKMAYKAHRHLLRGCGGDGGDEEVANAIRNTTIYNASIGNSYTASMYLALASLLDHDEDLAGQLIGFFSYGSGSVGELFAGTVVNGYQSHLRVEEHQKVLTNRRQIDYPTYRRLHEQTLPEAGGHYALQRETRSAYRLAALSAHKRIYESTAAPRF